jgi:RND family efflux transporter MFP subunit
MPPISELLKNKVVQGAIAIVVLIAIGSATYYLIESAAPAVTYASVTTGNIIQDVTATGVVTPVQNPTLSFEMGGQVASVNATVGETVSAGTVLASLDTSVLAAQLEAEQAKLNEMEAPPRTVDVAGQQTSVTTAQQSLANAYENYPQTLSSTLSQAEQAVYTGADPYFNLSTDENNPTTVFETNNDSNRVMVDGERYQLTQDFSAWQSQIASASASSSPADLQSMTSASLTYLDDVRSFLVDMITALNDAQIGPNGFTAADQAQALTTVNAALDNVNGLITALTNANQSLTSQQLAVESAQDSLNQTLAGATTQDIEAQQATVAGIQAQIAQEEIIAPFSGTVASVSVKKGDVVGANSEAVSLIPQGNFEVDVYLAENDATEVKVGDAVDITLDAYGTGRSFPATVSSVDTSPSTDPNSGSASEPGSSAGATGYKVVLVFNNADPAIANGMHANATIHAGSAQNVLLIPKSAVITNGTQSYVLLKTANGPVQTAVTLGLSNDTEVQVVSGLAAGDTVSAVGSQ